MKILTGILAVLAMSTFASANDLTVTSTAIVDNFGPACASKGNDTEALITQVSQSMPAVRGLLQQKSVVNSTPEYVPPSQHYDACAYTYYTCGGYPGYGGGYGNPYPGYGPGYGPACGYVCQGGFVTDPGYTENHYRCDTTLTVNSPDYSLSLSQSNQGDTRAQLNAALAKGNVVYTEIDGDRNTVRWVSVDKK